MAKEHILIIEDEGDILELIRFNLAREGYKVTTAISGEMGLRLARTDTPALILLDLMLPEIDGLEVCRTLKGEAKTQHIPVIMLTAKAEESDIVTGLEVGAEDYIVKPFSPKVLIARVRAVLRRRGKVSSDEKAPLKLHDLTIHPGRHEVLVDGSPAQLTLTEFQILHLLARRPGWVFSRDQILNEIRGDEAYVTDRSIDVQIVGLRKKLGNSGGLIETVRGVGYKMKE
jgi:two-component system, OmpR family, alkaline phosphatase synthesis response regulator PhoP